LKRGDIVTVALQGVHGKPRPALIVQSDLLTGTPLVALILLTSAATEAPSIRIEIGATAETGLSVPSFTMIERLTTAPRGKIGAVIGHLNGPAMLAVNRALAVFLGIA
jgi:mRNA interferase MazF